MLFVLIAYHVSSYMFTKDKSFALYAGYLLLVLMYLIPKTTNGTSLFLSQQFRLFFSSFNWILQVWFWSVYIWFSIYFLSIKEKKPKLFLYVIRYLQIMVFFSMFIFVIDLLWYKGIYFSTYYTFVFTPISLVFLALICSVIFKFKDPINNFYLFGLISFVGFSFVALYFTVTIDDFESLPIVPIDYFKIGVFLEAIVLSVGLGYKYHVYRQERNDLNVKLIGEYKKNETLKDELNTQLSVKLKSVSKQAEIYKIEQLEAHYKSEINQLKLTSLLSQMNPHFIFNALNSIKLYIINNEQKNAAYYLNKFSKLIRKILEAPTTKKVALEEELETMSLYMSIENIRFSNEINYTATVDEEVDVETIKIPPLILQPFLENAIWYGLSSKKGEKCIQLSVNKCANNCINISIEDNGIGREASAKITAKKTTNRNSNGTALSKERLEDFVKKSKTSFSINYLDLVDDDGKSAGTKAVLIIPLL